MTHKPEDVTLAARKRFRFTSDDLWGYAFIGVCHAGICACSRSIP